MLRKLLLFLVMGLLAGCASAVPARRPGLVKEGLLVTPTPLPVAVRTMIPIPSGAPNDAYPAVAYPPGTPPAYTYPKPVVTGIYHFPNLAYLAPTAYPAPPPQEITPGLNAQPGVSFRDCARTPGLVICDPSAPAIPARLAFFNAAAERLVVLDLENGGSWQTPVQAASLDWSPQGDRLLVYAGEGQYAVFDSEGTPTEAFTSPNGAQWQADNRLVRGQPPEVFSADSRSALLEQTKMGYILHISAADGSETRQLVINPRPADKLYALLGWVPGADTLLAQSYFASNAAMLSGGELITIDSQTGAEKNLGVTAHLGSRSLDLAWNPRQAGLLAVVASKGMTDQLALLDITTGEARYLLPEGLQVLEFAWQPDGQKLAFALKPGQTIPPELEKKIASPGIALLDRRTQAVEPLTLPPQGALDAWPHWSPDGKLLVYGRAIEGSAGSLQVQVRVHRVSDGMEWVLVDGLPAESGGNRGPKGWESLLTIVEK